VSVFLGIALAVSCIWIVAAMIRDIKAMEECDKELERKKEVEEMKKKGRLE
jgi:hypothetical protein